MSDLLAQFIRKQAEKLAQMDAEMLAQETGGMPPVDPATGQPMDPAMMDPAMAGAQEPPPTLEDLIATGDPLILLIVEIRDNQAALINAMKALLEATSVKIPASKMLESHMNTPGSSQLPAAGGMEGAKVSTMPNLIDDELDADELTPQAAVPAPEPALSLGSAATPGVAGTKLATGLYEAAPTTKRTVNAIQAARARC